MSVEPAGLLLTLAAVIVCATGGLGDYWVYRRRVSKRLQQLH